MERSSKADALLFWGVIATVVISDVITKWIAYNTLSHGVAFPREVIGETVRFWLVYNRGAAFGIHVGEYSRWVFLVLTIAALVILGRLYRQTRPGDTMRTLSLALVCGGAIGNLIDRVRWERGVVDFIDVGIGTMRWPTFNIADMAVSTGAFMLAWVLWGEDREAARRAAETGPPPGAGPALSSEPHETR
jgi:signal peptidase II